LKTCDPLAKGAERPPRETGPSPGFSGGWIPSRHEERVLFFSRYGNPPRGKKVFPRKTCKARYTTANVMAITYGTFTACYSELQEESKKGVPMSSERTKLWYLKNLDVFSHLREEEHRMIHEYSNMREVKKGEILYLQGSSDHKLYMLKKGMVKITKLSPQGRELILDIIQGGSIFGELNMVEPGDRDESAQVIEDGLICDMKKKDFDRLLELVPGLSLKVTKMMGLRRWKLENKLLDMLYSTVEHRLAKTILNLLEDFGVPHEDGVLLKIKLTHKDFADLVASTRETVTLTLNSLKKEGYLESEGRYVVVPSLARLNSLVHTEGPR